MTWRERIARASERKRGWRGFFRQAFSYDEKVLAWSTRTCAGAEILQSSGLQAEDYSIFISLEALGECPWEAGKSLYLEFPLAIEHGNIRLAGKIVDTMEDRVLELKRKYL